MFKTLLLIALLSLSLAQDLSANVDVPSNANINVDVPDANGALDAAQGAVQDNAAAAGDVVSNAINDNVQAAQDTISDNAQAVQDAATNYASTAQDAAGENAQAIQDAATNIADAATQAAADNSQLIGDTINNNAQNVQNAVDGNLTGQDVQNVVDSATQAVQEGVDNTSQDVKDNISNNAQAAVDAAAAAGLTTDDANQLLDELRNIQEVVLGYDGEGVIINIEDENVGDLEVLLNYQRIQIDGDEFVFNWVDRSGNNYDLSDENGEWIVHGPNGDEPVDQVLGLDAGTLQSWSQAVIDAANTAGGPTQDQVSSIANEVVSQAAANGVNVNINASN